MSKSILANPTVQTSLVIAVILTLAGIAFMASVQTELWDAAGAIAGLLVLIALVSVFKALK